MKFFLRYKTNKTPLIAMLLLGALSLDADEVSIKVEELKGHHAKTSDLRQEALAIKKEVEEVHKIQRQMNALTQSHLKVSGTFESQAREYQKQKGAMEIALEKDKADLESFKTYVERTIEKALSSDFSLNSATALRREFRVRIPNERSCQINHAHQVYLKMKKTILLMASAASHYRQTVANSPLSTDYPEVVAEASQSAKQFTQRASDFAKDHAKHVEAIEPPKICSQMGALGRLISVRTLLLEVEQTGEDLSSIQFGLEGVLSEIENQELAIEYTGAARRAIRGLQGKFSMHLNLSQASEAAEVADHIEGTTYLILNNLEQSPVIMTDLYQSLKEETDAIVSEVIAEAHQKLGPHNEFRRHVLLRAKNLQARMHAIEQENADNLEWQQLSASIREDVGMPEQGRFRVPKFNTKEGLTVFDLKLANAESSIRSLGIEQGGQ